ncbi:MAG: hypothetical protein HFG37_03980 [Eubacterium sp.]|nr:hypothetical protein [Eubacterium sp.]
MEAVRAYNNEFTRLSERVKESGIHVSSYTIAQKAANNTMKNASETARNIVANTKNNTVSLNSLTKSSKAATIGMQAVSNMGNMLAGSAISATIDTVFTFVSEMLQKGEKLKESSRILTAELSSSQINFANSRESLSTLQSEYDKLSKHVDSLGRHVSGTNEEYERYKEIMSQIAAIMPEMDMRYDAHGNAVSTMTGKIKDLKKEYEKIQQQKILQLFNEKDENGNNIYDIMEDAQRKSYVKRIQRQRFPNLKDPIEELMQDIENNKYQGAELGGAKNKLLELQQQQKEQYDVWRTYAGGYAQFYDPNNDGSSEFFNLSEDQQAFLSSFFNNMSPQFIEENELTSQDAVTLFVSQWIDALGKEDGKINEAFNQLLNFDFDTKDMNPEKVREMIDNLIQNLLNAMQESGMDIDTSENGVASFKVSWGIKFVDENAENYKNKLDRFNFKHMIAIPDIDENGDMQFTTQEVTNKDRDEELHNWADHNNVTESELDKLKDQGYDFTTSIDVLSNALEAIREKPFTPTSFKDVWKYIGKSGNEEIDRTALEEKKKLEELAETGKLTNESLKNSSLAEIFTEAGVSIEEATNKINKMKSSVDQLASMRTGISSISSILGEKKENLSSKNTKNDGIGADTLKGMPEDIKAQKREYEHFVNVLGNGKSSMEECQKAANKLASAYVNSNNFLANLTDQNKDYYASVLNEMGIENAREIVHNKLIQSGKNLNVITKELGISKNELSSLTLEEASNLDGLSDASDEAKQSLYYYMLQKVQQNQISLNTSADCDQLYNLAFQAGIAKSNLRELTNASIALSSVEGYQNKIDAINRGLDHAKDGSVTYIDPNTSEVVTTSERSAYNTLQVLQKGKNAAEKRAKKNIDNFTEKNEMDPVKITSSNNSDDKRNKSTSTKQQIDWIERRIKNLQDTIDLTAAKLQNLFRFKSKNKNLNKQIKTTTKLINTYGTAAAKYQKKADQITGLSKAIIQKVNTGKLTKKTSLSDLIKEYGEEDAGRIQSYISYTDKAREERKNRQDQITKKRNLKQQKYQNYVDRADGKISLYEQQKENSGTAKRKNSILDRELKQYKESYVYQIKIAGLTKNKTEQSRLRAEYEKKIRDSKEEKLQNTLNDNSDKNNLLEAKLANAFTADDKNHILEEEIGIIQSNTAAYEKNYSDAVSYQSSQANSASKSVNSDKSKKLKKSDKEKIKSYISRKEPIPDKLINKCSPKTQEQLANYNASLNWVQDAFNQKTLNEEEAKTKERDIQIQQHENRAVQHQSELDLLSAQKENQKTAKDKNQIIDKEKNITAQLYNEKIAIAGLEGNIYEQQKLQEELSRQLVAYEKEKFANIVQYYDNLRKLNEHQSKNLNNAVDELEARGMIATSELYTSQMALNEEKKRNYQEELFQLEQQHDKIEKGTQDWYDSLDSIQACRDNIAQCTRNSIELGNAVRSIDWKIFDKASSRMDLISSEFDLGIKLMSNKNLTNKDTGNFTQEGTATLGAYYSKMLLAQNKKNEAGNILIKTKRHIDNRDEGYTDQKALDEYNEKYKEYIQLAETEFDIQQNIVDMMKNRYQAELDCLQDVINKRKDLLQTEKDAFDYQQSIEEKTKNIAVITKQLTALRGDDSEEAKTRIQQLQVSLDDANKDLQDTEYQHWITDQQTMLDNFYNEYSDFIDTKINDTDALLSEATKYLGNIDVAKSVSESLQEYYNAYGYNPTDDLKKINTALGANGNIAKSIKDSINDISMYFKTQQKYQSEADHVTNAISEIGNVYEDENAIKRYEEARRAYDSLATAGDNGENIQSYVASSAVSTLDTTKKEVQEIYDSVSNTRSAINSIGDLEDRSGYNEYNKQLIQAAYDSYNKLSTSGKQLLGNHYINMLSYKKQWYDYWDFVIKNEEEERKAQEAERQRQEEERQRQEAAAAAAAAAEQDRQNKRNAIKNWFDENKNKSKWWDRKDYDKTSKVQKYIDNRIFDHGLKYLNQTGLEKLNSYLDTIGIPSGKLLNRLTSLGFSHGGIVDTLQKIPGMNGDDGWATLKRGEAVLTPEQTEDFQKLLHNLDVVNPAVDLYKSMQTKNIDMVSDPMISQSTGDINIDMSFPGVTNYEEFRQKLQSDPKIERMFKSMIWNKGSLSKYSTKM